MSRIPTSLALNTVPGLALTAGTMTVSNSAEYRMVLSKYSWTNAMVVALGAALTGDIIVCTLPAKTYVLKALVVVTGTAAGVTTLTGGLGRTTAAFADYIVASDLKVAANTIYGNAAAELGTNLSELVGDIPSLTATTAIKLHCISTVQNLDATTGSTGDIYIWTALLP